VCSRPPAPFPHSPDLFPAAADGHTFDCAQIKRVVEKAQFGDAVTTAAINLHGKCTNPEQFQSVLAALPYDEDRTKVKEALGL
jgi:hypothetical protein